MRKISDFTKNKNLDNQGVPFGVRPIGIPKGISGKEDRKLDANKSYRNNLIERLNKFLKSLIRERETHRTLSEEIVSDRQFHGGQ